MDWPRLLRALDAAGIERTEKRRAQMMDGSISMDEISNDDWAAFARHDNLYNRWHNGTVDDVGSAPA